MIDPLFGRRRIEKSTLATVLCLALVSPAEGKKKVRLKNKPITLAEFQFCAAPQKEHGLVVVSYGVVGVGVILPYSKTWEFVIQDDGRLTGGDKHHQMTLGAWEATAETEKDYLEGLLRWLEGSVHVRKVSFLKIDTDLVLRYQTQPRQLPEAVPPLDPWWWHYRSV